MRAARRSFSIHEAGLLWEQWKAGATLSKIAILLNRKPGTVHCYLSRFGGMAPRRGRRSALSLSAEEREEVSRGLAAGSSARAIARQLGRAPSTITREIKRNGGRRKYRSAAAEREAVVRRRRPQKLRLERDSDLRSVVEQKLKLDWSPEQIAGWLRRESGGLRVSHESIYRALYLPSRSGLSKHATGSLRSRRKMRRSRRATNSGQTRGQIVGARPLSERPPEAESRKQLGHWEGDLIAGKANTHVATLVERTTRFTVMLALGGKDAATVTAALQTWLESVPLRVRRTLTWDRGTELARHAELTSTTGVPVFFCDPKSPWQRGTNENTNRLIRQYLPKGTRLDQISQAELNVITNRLNERPRKVLRYRSPKNAFAEGVALTA